MADLTSVGYIIFKESSISFHFHKKEIGHHYPGIVEPVSSLTAFVKTPSFFRFGKNLFILTIYFHYMVEELIIDCKHASMYDYTVF